MPTETAIPPPSKFVWYELHTPNTDAATRFYGGVLGWGTRERGMDGAPYTLVTVGQTPVGGILQKPAAAFSQGNQPHWIGYLGVEDVDRRSDALVAAGGVVLRQAEDIPEIGRFAVVADPQGAPFVLFQPPPGMQQPAALARGTLGTSAWHDLITLDWTAEFDFYAGLFGWSKSDAMDMGPNGTYQVFTAGSEPIGGMMNRMDPAVPPGWLFYFHVAEIHAAVTRVAEHGGNVIHGPSPVPGGLLIAHCLDTQGAIFGIVAPAAAADAH